MSTASHPRKPWPPSGAHRRKLWCIRCESNEHLVIDSIDAPRPPSAGFVEVTYTCVECDAFYAHTASVAGVAESMNRPDQLSGVLRFGSSYLHCGEPMTTAASRQRSVQSTHLTERSSEELLEMYLRTKVLHCRCGFQMEIPD